MTKKLATWAKTGGNGGLEVGIQILGFGGNIGRTTSLPPLADAPYENIKDAVACVAAESIERLNVDCALVALDNVENLEDAELADILVVFRDTLFMVPKIWWVIIGQSGLASLIVTLDSRISDRISGASIEMKRMTFGELQEAIAKRIAKFNLVSSAKSLLS